MSDRFLLYGANGYTGELITRFAAERGMKPILAGRSEAKIPELAANYGFEYRTFALDDNEKLDAALQEVDMVLHCAGPFSLTSRPMVEACLRNKSITPTSRVRSRSLRRVLRWTKRQKTPA